MNPELLDRMPPTDIEAERNVLGCIILKGDVLDDIGSELRIEDFYVDSNGRLYGHLLAMHSERIGIDTTTLVSRLKQVGDYEMTGGAACIAEAMQSVPDWHHASHYARLVMRAARYRTMITTSLDTVRDSYAMTDEPTEILNRAEAALAVIGTNQTHKPVAASTAMREVLERIDLIQQRGQSAGLMTGLRDFDRHIGGLFGEELIILAARPGVGKSAMAMQIAYHNAAKLRTVYFASLEMSRVALMTRLICSVSGVNSQAVRSGQLTEADQKLLVRTSTDVAEIPLHLHDYAELTVYDIRRAARRMRREALDLVVVDYLQLIRPENPRDPRHEQVALMTRRLKALAGELQVPVLVLCQLNRASEKDDYPKLSALRESGAIEQDADVVLFLHRKFKGPAKETDDDKPPLLIVGKNRNGDTGAFPLEWIASETRYQCVESQTHSEFDDFA